MEASSTASAAGRFPGYPATAIPAPQAGKGGILATLYVARLKVAAVAVALSLAAGGLAAVSRSLLNESSVSGPAEVAVPIESPAVPAPEPKPATAMEPSHAQAPKAAADTDLKAKEDRLASLEKAAAKMEAMLSVSDKPSPQAVPVPRAEIKVTSAERSGFWRYSGKDEQNFVIVEAVGDDGGPVDVAVTDMDTGKTVQVSRWAVRIPADEFSRLSAEKAVSGSIGGMVAGVREKGAKDVDWKISVSGGALVEWKEDSQ